MSELVEELEPLFDYRRVQPPAFVVVDDDDDDESSSPSRAKRVKLSDKVKKVNEDQKEIVHILDNEENDELDWLPPPPKISRDSKLIEEDSTIKELRLKRQELLESLAQSAEDVIRAVEEDLLARRNHEVSSSKERAKIVISIQDKVGVKQFRVYKDDKFERLFRMYGDRNKLEMTSLVFCFDGDKICPMATPDGLGMEDDDIIEVHVTNK